MAYELRRPNPLRVRPFLIGSEDKGKCALTPGGRHSVESGASRG